MTHPRGLVIFDLDGTLFRGADATIAAVRQAFQEMALRQPDQEEIEFYVGKPADELHAWLCSKCRVEQASTLVAAVDRYELAYVQGEDGLYPGAAAALAEIRALVTHMAICTNGPRHYVERVIDIHDIGGFFDIVRYRQSGDKGKTSMVRELLVKLTGRPAILVGDRQDDVEAAHRNGLAVVAATYGYGSSKELAHADVAVASPCELPQMIASLLDGWVRRI